MKKRRLLDRQAWRSRDRRLWTDRSTVAPRPPPRRGDAGGGLAHAAFAARAFEAAGATAFLVGLGSSQEPDGYTHLGELAAERFRQDLPALIDRSDHERRSLIARPVDAEGNTVGRDLDDLDAARLARVEPFAFLSLETSPGSFHAWLKVDDEETARRLVRGLGTDESASGAIRWPGSHNWKHADAPLVRLLLVRRGLVAAAAELEGAGLLAPISPPRPLSPKPDRALASPDRRGWPEYDECLDHWKGDTLRADLRWCWIALKRGHSEEAVAARLLDVRERTDRKGTIRYAQQTVFTAGTYVT